MTPNTPPVEAAPPRVSAIVVSYNNVESLRRCIAALDGSKDRDALEILVVDKGSRDGSANIDAEFAHVTMLRLPRNFGTTKALNIGMRTAAAELVFFLVPEVEVQPDTIPLLANAVEADDDVVAACPILGKADQFYRLPTPQTGAALQFINPDTNSAERVSVPGATFDAMLARKYFVRGINFLDEKFGEQWSDVDLCFQIRRSGKKVLVIPQAACAYTPRPEEFPESALTLLEADRAAGAARYFGKYYGFFSGLMFRLRSTLKALFSFRLGLFAATLSGRKVDGTQSEL
jgi:GT2 family glycosyltransferase